MLDLSSETSEQNVAAEAYAVHLHLEAILNSPEFRLSRRSSEFLRHIVQHATTKDFDSLKERILGIEIFHRPNDYDTSTDAVVRVTANDVRRRLSNFYTEHGSGGAVSFALPLGTYVPEFHWSGEPLPEIPASKAQSVEIAPPLSGFPAVGADPAVEQAQAVFSKTTPPAADEKWRFHRIALVLAAAFSIGMAGWFARGFKVQSRIPPRLHIYEDLLGTIGADPQNITEVALSNPRVLLYRGSLTAAKEQEDELQVLPVPQQLVKELNTTANDTQADYPYHWFQVDGDNYTGMGEAHAAFALGGLMESLGRHVRLTEARFLNWDAARRQQLIILGAPHMSAFAQGTLTAVHFAMEHDEIRNNHPAVGEEAVYRRIVHDSQLIDYGLIWMAKSPSGARVLVLAGLTSTGTGGVGDFFNDPDKMQGVFEQLRAQARNGNFPETWQALIRVDARENVPVKMSLVAVHAND